MTHKSLGPIAPIRHRSWRTLPLLSLLAALTNSLCAANVPTFSYFASGDGSVNVIASDSAANTYIAGSAPTLESGIFQINVRLPADLTAGVQFLSVTVGGAIGAPAAISIQ